MFGTRLTGGKIAEQWGFPDIHGLMEQLGPSSAAKTQAPQRAFQKRSFVQRSPFLTSKSVS
jgi:hypothetical protein